MTAVAAEATALDAARRVDEALGDAVSAVYVVGSAALGGFEPGSSDLDVVAVLGDRPVDLDALVQRVLAVDVAPARGLELVVYARGTIALNLNTRPLRIEREPEPAGWFWFVLDRAVAQERALALRGPAWNEVFAPVPRDDALAALDASLAWHERHEPGSRNTVLNAVRAWRYLETGEWVSKPAASFWLLARVREEVARAR